MVLDDPAGEGRLVVGRLGVGGLDPALKRLLTAPGARRPTLRTALAPDGLRRMIREQRVLVIPNPYRRLEDDR